MKSFEFNYSKEFSIFEENYNLKHNFHPHTRNYGLSEILNHYIYAVITTIH